MTKKFIPIFSIAAILIAMAIVFSSQNENSILYPPLENYENREKFLTFGLFVTPNPEQNPIDPPERFTGYHTALDIETFEEEKEKDVPVFAACDGPVMNTSTADGYGGVIIQQCKVNNEDVMVLYGHLNPGSFKFKVGDDVTKKSQLAILGEEKTMESGFTRKHLHFGIHRGTEIKLLGYVQTQAELQEFIDPQPLLPD